MSEVPFFGLPPINTFGTSPSTTPALGLDTIIDNAVSGNPLPIQSVADMVTAAATTPPAPSNTSQSGSTYQAGAKAIPMPKWETRIHTVRPRSTGRKDRGAIARMRILPLDKQAFLASNGVKEDKIPKDLFSENPELGWNEFFLTNVQCQMTEKVQVMEVFGDNHVAYYFGKSPTMFTLSGMVFDNLDSDWFTKFVETYENFLRGSKLAKNYALLEIMLPNIKIIGSVMNFSYNQDSHRDTDIMFSMQILAKAVETIPLSIPEVDSGSLNNAVNWPKAIGSLPKSALNSVKTYANLLSYIGKPISPTTDLLSLANSFGKTFSPLSDSLNFAALNNLNETADLSSPTSPFSSVQSIIGGVGGPVTAAAGTFMGQLNAAGNSIMGSIPTGTFDSLGNQLQSAVTIIPDYSSMNIEVPGTAGLSIPSLFVDGSKLQDFTTGLMGAGSKITDSVTGAMPELMSSSSNLMSSAQSAASGIMSSPGMGNLISSASGLMSGAMGSIGGIMGGNNAILGGISSTITGFKSGLFSPVFGFLSSITKIVTSVTGDISKVLMSFTSPVNSVLRDITGISNEIKGITNLLTSSINQLVGIPRQTLSNITSTINSLRSTAGAISRIPVNITDSFGALFKSGSISKGAVILKSSHGRIIQPAIILNSGTAWTQAASMTIPSSIRKLT